jgi:integrase
VKAGLADKRSKKNTGRGHSVKRTVSELTFHSLRHNTTSWLKKAGVPESVVRDIIGHESELVSRDYTHVDDDSNRDAIRRLPNIFGAPVPAPSRPPTGKRQTA